MILAPLVQEKNELAPQDSEDLLQFDPQLANDLLALADVRLGLLPHQALPRATDGKTLVIEKAPNLSDDQDVLALIITPVATPFDRLQLRELLFPVTQYVRLHRTQITHLSDSEIAFSWDWR